MRSARLAAIGVPAVLLSSGCGFRSGLDGEPSSLVLESASVDKAAYLQGEEVQLVAKVRNEGPVPVDLPRLVPAATIDSTDVSGDFELLSSLAPPSVGAQSLAEVVYDFRIADLATTGEVDGTVALADTEQSLPVTFTTQPAATLVVDDLRFEGENVACIGVRPLSVIAEVSNHGVSAGHVSGLAFGVKNAAGDITDSFVLTLPENPASVGGGALGVLFAGSLLPAADAVPGDALLARFSATVVDGTTGRPRPEPDNEGMAVLPAFVIARPAQFDESFGVQEAATNISAALPVSVPVSLTFQNTGTVTGIVESVGLVILQGATDVTGEYQILQAATTFPLQLAPGAQSTVGFDVLLTSPTPTPGAITVRGRVAMADPACGIQLTNRFTDGPGNGAWNVVP